MSIVGFLSQNAALAAAHSGKERILFLGDSLTEGVQIPREAAYPALIQKQLAREGHAGIEVINAGISGSTSSSGLARMKWHLRQKPDILVLALGANDGLRGLSLTETRTHLIQTIELAKKNGIKVLLAGMKIPLNYGEKYRQEFESLFFEVAKKEKVPLIPFLLEGVAGDPKLNLSDALHPNEKGHEIVAKTVLKYLEPML